MYDGVLVQTVEVYWTKASRGGPAATRRNAVPLGFPWPDADVAWHGLAAREWEDFETTVSVDSDVPAEVGREVGLRREPDAISFQPDVDPFWMPLRHRRPPRVRLRCGQRARWVINHRTGLDHGWAYGQVTVNVAFGVTDTSALFTAEPDVFVDERATLR